MMHLFSQINWLAILLGTVAYFGLGMLWFGPLLGKQWLALKNIDPTKMTRPSPTIFIIPVVLTAVATLSLALFAAGLGVHDIVGNIRLAVYLNLGMYATVHGINSVFNQVPFKLFLIEVGYHLTGFVLAGAILGVMQ